MSEIPFLQKCQTIFGVTGVNGLTSIRPKCTDGVTNSQKCYLRNRIKYQTKYHL